MPGLPPVSVHLLPSLISPGTLAGGVAVVVDVLRASTVMVHALASGCKAIIPCLEIDEAHRVASSLPEGSALLAGERQGVPIEGFDLGNSPDDFTPETCRGKTLVMTTTNGTRAILASLEADRVLIGSFVNHDETLAELPEDRPLHLVCSGTDGLVSFEDTLCAGRWAVRLLAKGRSAGNDQALIASGFWQGFERARERGEVSSLKEYLIRGRGGQRVRELGLEADLDAAARISPTDRFRPMAIELRRDPLRIVPSGL